MVNKVLSINEQLEKALEAKNILPSTHKQLKEWLSSKDLPQWIYEALKELVEKKAWEELNNRFYKQISFGTGGMRGGTFGEIITLAERGNRGESEPPIYAAAGSNMMNDINVVRATLGLYRYAEKVTQSVQNSIQSKSSPKIVIAYDIRHFSRHFAELTAFTWMKQGGEAYLFKNPRSTPELSFAVRTLKATAGVVITASHNPPYDNGFKAYFKDGGQVVSPHAEGIIECVNATTLQEAFLYVNTSLEKVKILDENLDRQYLQVLQSFLVEGPATLQKSQLKVVYTPIHGTGQAIIVPLLKAMDVELSVVEEQMVQDPNFSTVQSPNPENAEAFTLALKRAQKVGADIVLGTDPDADRMGIAFRKKDGTYQLLNGNIIGSLLAEFRITQLKRRGLIPQEGSNKLALIKTFVTTPLQAAIAEYHGIKLIETLTGFKYIAEKLENYETELKTRFQQKNNKALDYDNLSYLERLKLLQEYSTFFIFGGEESYGYLAGDFVRDKDANMAVLLFCEMMAYLKNERLSLENHLEKIYRRYGYYAEQLLNLEFEGATEAKKIKKILESYRNNPPSAFLGADLKIERQSFEDFGKQTIRDADGQRIPSQDFFILKFSNEITVAVRGSGTEPKIKFYLFAKRTLKESESLSHISDQTKIYLEKLKEEIRMDAVKRAES